MKVYIIAGKARSGKSQAAKFMKELLEKKQKRVAVTEYSKYIKLFAKDLLGWDMVSEPKPRDFLQQMGDYVRSLKKDIYFVERMKSDLSIYEHFVDVVIISDARLPQELDALDDYSPVKIKVVSDLNYYDLNEVQASHITEHALDDYDKYNYIIKNKNMDEMRIELEKIIEEERSL